MLRITTTLFLIIFVFTTQAQIIPDYYPDQFKEILESQKDPWNQSTTTFQSANQRTDVYGDPPSWKWAKQFGGDGFDAAYDITEDEQNNLYAIGSFSGKVSIGGNEYISNGLIDLFIAKASSTGDLIWFKTFSAQAGESMRGTSIKYKDGSLVLAGYFEGSTDFGTGGTTISSDNEPVSFLGEIDTDGNFNWYRSYWNPVRNTRYATRIDKDNSGNIFLLTGSFFSAFNVNGSLTKFNETGGVLLEINEPININRFELTSLGLYVTGTIFTEVTIGDVTFIPPTFQNAFVAKSDLNFNFEWGHVVDISSGFGDSNGMLLASDAAENVYFGGFFGNSALINNIPSPQDIGFGLFFVKLEFGGDFEWVTYVDNSDFFTFSSRASISSTGDLITGGNLFNPYTTTSGTTIYREGGSNTLLLVFDQNDGSIVNEKLNNTSINSIRNNGLGRIMTAATQSGNLTFGTLDNNLENDLILKTEGETGFISGWNNRKVFTDAEANNYCVTRFLNNLFFDNTQAVANDNGVAIIKTDVNGNLIWIKEIESSVNIAALGADLSPDQTNIVIGGAYAGIIETDLGTFSSNTTKGYLAKFDTNTGDLLFFNEVDPSVNDVAIDQDNDIVSTGVFSDMTNIDGITLTSNGDLDFFVAKFDSEGSLSWAGGFGGAINEFQPYIDVDNQKNIYVYALSTSSFIGFGSNINLTLLDGAGDLIMAKYNPNGTPLWASNFGGGTDPASSDFSTSPYGLHISEAGDIFIEGRMGFENNFGSFLLVNPDFDQNTGDYRSNNFLAKLDLDGEFIWANIIKKRQNFTNSYQITPDELGNLYITGSILSDTYFSDDAFIEQEINMRIGFVAKYDTLGQISWVKSIDNGENRPAGIAVFAEDQLTISGEFYSAVEIGGNNFTATSTKGYLASTTDQVTSTRPDDFSNTFILKADPNPVPDQFVLSYEMEQNSKVLLRIFDLQGRLVISKTLGDKNIGKHQEVISMEGLSLGMYFVNVVTDLNSGVIKVEKIK